MSGRFFYFAAIGLVASVAFALAGSAHVTRAAGGGVSGIVFIDTNMDGVRDPGEPPAPGRTVELLLDPFAERLDTVKTASDGRYHFDGLAPDTIYNVAVVHDAKAQCTINTGPSFVGDTKTTGLDLAVVPPGDRRVSGTLVSDLNENGEKDVGEPPLSGWALRLMGYGGPECEVDSVTGANGEFEFNQLPAGIYGFKVTAGSPSLPATVAWQLAFVTRPPGVSSAYPGMHTPDPSVDLGTSKNVDGMAIGIHVLSGTASLTSWIFHDLDLDGTKDAGEQPFDCCVVIVLRPTPLGLLLVQSAHDHVGVGHYEWAGLPAGDYTVTLGTWYLAPTAPVDQDGRPVRVLTLREGEAAVAAFGFGPQPPQPTEEPPPLETPPGEPPSTAMPAPAPASVSLPRTGDASPGSDDHAAPPDVAIGVLGLAALAFAARRRRSGRKSL